VILERARILAEKARWSSVLDCVEGPWEAIGNGPVKVENEVDLDRDERERVDSRQGDPHVEN